MTEVVPVPILSNLNIHNIDQILHRDLIANSNDNRALVSYGFKQNGQTHFIGRREALENNWSLDFVEGLALQALDKHEEPEWEPVEVKYQGTTHTLLKREGDDLTASSILRKKLLTEIQSHFGTKSVGFAVPNRNTIIAAAVPEALLIYLNDSYHASDAQGYEKVSNMVYLVRNGNVLAAAPMPADVPAPQPIASAATSTPRDVGTGTSANMKKPKRPTRSLKAGKSKLNARRSGNASKAGNASAPPVEDATPAASPAATAAPKKMRSPGARKKISIKKKR